MYNGTTSPNPGQCFEISHAIDRVLMRAIAPFDIKEVISGVQDGSALEQHMRSMFRSLLGKPDFVLPSSRFKRDMAVEKQWDLIEDCGRTEALTPDTIKNLELVPFLEKTDNGWIDGDELVVRARSEKLQANYGQEDAEFLLECQDRIPKRFRDYYLIFTGTIWLNRHGNRIVARLYWRSAGGWCLYFGRLGRGYGDDDRLLRLGKWALGPRFLGS